MLCSGIACLVSNSSTKLWSYAAAICFVPIAVLGKLPTT